MLRHFRSFSAAAREAGLSRICAGDHFRFDHAAGARLGRRIATFVLMPALLSPWLLGYATNDVAWLNELVSGGLLVVLCSNAAGLSHRIRGRKRHGRTAQPASATVQPAGSGS